MSLVRRLRFWGKDKVDPDDIELELDNFARQAVAETAVVVTTFKTADVPPKTVTVYQNGTIKVG
jgi:hypothetical protein